MGDIVSLDDQRPHIGGPAKCLCCGHEWHAVAMSGTLNIECPECHTLKGVFSAVVSPETRWECKCGNDLFFIDTHDMMCANCGLRHWPFG